MSSPASTWYYAADGERVGPRSLDQMRILFADGTLTGETLVWAQGMATWAPAAALPILAQAPESELAEPVLAVVPPPLPAPLLQAQPGVVLAWRRFFARWFDMMSMLTVGLLAAGYTTPEEIRAIPPLMVPVALLGTVVVQALFVAALGTTPGKAIFGLRLNTVQGERLALGRALLRELMVWALGMGMCLDLLVPITHAFAYYRLTRRGTTPWDDRLGVSVQAVPLGPMQALAIAALLVLSAFALVAGLQGMAAG